ncbi:hypothetical protein OQA88_7754 [Cercophora sp. LCS_1]
MRVAVIGAGPSGLVTLKYLLEAHKFLDTKPIEAVLFESEDSIGGTFAHRTYEDAELVSSKQLTTFSDFRPLPEDPDFLPVVRYLRYLADYCTHFDLWPHIKLSSKVVSIAKSSKGHTISWTSKDAAGKITATDSTFDAVAVCSGLHVTPNMPKISGIENVPVVLHSSEFKTKSQFGVDKTVLILGTGETGMDVAYMAVNSPTKRVLLSHRDGFLCAPKRVPDPVILPILGTKPSTSLNVPVDSSSASLFDTAYVHRRLRDHSLLWTYYDVFIKSTLWLVGGSKYGLGQFIGGISSNRYHASKIFFNKSNLAMPYISAPYLQEHSSSLTQRIRSSLIQVPLPTPTRHIDLAPWPSHFTPSGAVIFTNNSRPEYTRLSTETIKPDIVILATGYTQTFPFLSSPYHTPINTPLTRSIYPASDPTIGFIGFVRPSFGAIPPLAELQAQLWISRLVCPNPKELKAEDEEHYKLKHPKGSRITYGVDHESYAYQMALDMDAAPSFGEVVRAGWRVGQVVRVLGVWALGANFNVKFRLRGPWKWDGAVGGMLGLWETVERRGGFFGLVTLNPLLTLIGL